MLNLSLKFFFFSKKSKFEKYIIKMPVKELFSLKFAKIKYKRNKEIIYITDKNLKQIILTPNVEMRCLF